MSRVNNWHKANRWVYELSQTKAILDYVEDLIGPNILQWGSHCFAKFPGDGTEVPWHQDAQYWPLQPSRTVTVWLAIFDTNEQNAAMRIVKGSHRHVFEHHLVPGGRHRRPYLSVSAAHLGARVCAPVYWGRHQGLYRLKGGIALGVGCGG